MLVKAIEKALKNKIGCKKVHQANSFSSGTVHQCFTYETDLGKFFVKTCSGSHIDLYAAESKGLEKISDTKTIRVPQPQYYGLMEDHCFIIIEYIDLFSHTKKSQESLGIQLAKMHLLKNVKKFGFEIDNSIGPTPQKNPWKADWIEFFRDYRLGFQFSLVEARYQDKDLVHQGEKLLEKLPQFFEGVVIMPSLLHGDLWSGNTGSTKEDEAVVFDPCCYFGHHEAELGITKMFGGFQQEFYEAYHSLIPQSPGFEERSLLYQLYHYLNHYLIFGSSYRSKCLSILETLNTT